MAVGRQAVMPFSLGYLCRSIDNALESFDAGRTFGYSSFRDREERPRKQVVTVLSGLVIFMAIFAILALAALVAGADSRDGNDWFVHRHA